MKQDNHMKTASDCADRQLSRMRSPDLTTRFSLRSDTGAVAGLLLRMYALQVRECGCSIDRNIQTTSVALRQAARWLTDPNGYPWLWIHGGIGTGKTTLARALFRLLDICRCRISPPDGWRNSKGGQSLKWDDMVWTDADSMARLEVLDGLKSVPILFIDDIGAEPAETLSFGNVRSPLIEVLLRRYDLRLMTIMTSNLPSVRGRYGNNSDRLADRMIEMAEKIIIDGASRRIRRSHANANQNVNDSKSCSNY